jgi:ubiquinone/menaquinone biosynthesis C-methylase UbiE
LRTSREALEVFQAIAVEVGRMVGATQLKPTLPNLADVEAKRIAERARRPKERVDLRQFWSDYLLGRDREFGIELMTATRAYRDLMTRQLEFLGIVSGGRFADLGSGTSAFAAAVLGLPGHAEIVVDQFDYVREALNRSRLRLAMSNGARVGLRFVECDLSAPASLAAIPVKSSTYDGVIASLVLSYVADPLALLREMRRILKPGGRLVVSSLRRDADISRIFREGFEELRSGVAEAQLGISEQSLDRSARKFLNEAARLLEHEEAGVFRFYDAKELAGLAESAGFEDVKRCVSFGSPGQAVIVAATKGVDPRGGS